MKQSCKGYKKPKPDEWIMRPSWYMPDAPCVHGHMWPRNKFGHCIKCVRLYRAKNGHFTANGKHWRKDNKARLNSLRADYNKRNPAKKMVTIARLTAKRRGVPFDLDESDLILPKTCPVLGVRLNYNLGKRTDATASLDRITPLMGYVKGNVVVVSWKANKIKSDATIEELEMVAAYYKRFRQLPLLKD